MAHVDCCHSRDLGCRADYFSAALLMVTSLAASLTAVSLGFGDEISSNAISPVKDGCFGLVAINAPMDDLPE